MKTIIAFFILICLCFSLFSCAKEKSYVFNAVILELNSSILVEPQVDSTEYKSSDKIVVHIGDAKIYDANKNKIDISELLPGQSIVITYNGLIAESYPAQIWAIRVDALQ